jgi:hypothetical protein
VLGRMAPTAAAGSAGNGHQVAPPELADVVALEESARGSGQAAHPVGGHRTDPPDLAGEPDLGRAAHSRRDARTRVLPGRVHGRPLHAQAPGTTDAELEDIPEEPPVQKQQPSIS